MTDSLLLIGSLSNDLFRVANFAQKGSTGAASRFLTEAKRWSVPLESLPVKDYILNIAKDISQKKSNSISMEEAEKYLMYGILLQNYALHNK